MKCFSIKRAYFVVATVFTLCILIGSYAVVFKGTTNSDWARELIYMCLALWIPSPAEHLKDMLEKRRQQTQLALEKNNSFVSASTKTETDSSVSSTARAESFVAKVPPNIQYPRETTLIMDRYPPIPAYCNPPPIAPERQISDTIIEIPSPKQTRIIDTPVSDVHQTDNIQTETKIEKQSDTIVVPASGKSMTIQVELVD